MLCVPPQRNYASRAAARLRFALCRDERLIAVDVGRGSPVSPYRVTHCGPAAKAALLRRLCPLLRRES